ncbi:MAG: molecular chaperone DnaJ, partial [Sorangium cellulosum]
MQGCDLRSLPLSPTEAFVLSRVDGMVSSHEIASMTGIDGVQVDHTLDRLAKLGAVTWDRTDNQRVTERAGAKNRTSNEGLAGVGRAVVETSSTSSREISGRPALYDPAELNEECDLPPDKRRRILDTFYRLEGLTYYELLGVEQAASKKEI